MRLRILSLLAFCSLIHLGIHAQLRHVEPLNWWVGMKDPRLQLMVHGTDVGNTVPVIDYPGVKLIKVSKADSRNFLFIDILIDKAARPGQVPIRFMRDGKTMHTYPYTLRKRDEGAARTKGFDGSDVIYLITPDRFANGDSTNDVVAGMAEKRVDRKGEGARHGGDIRGIIDRLDYIRDMGFTAIWPQPMLENNMPAYSYHGYAITNHYRVDARFGTMEEYLALSTKAAERGIRLIFDGILNHTGTGYWWMDDLPFRDWLNYADTKTRTNHNRTVNQDPYASASDRDIWVKGWFDVSMADMNGANPYLADYLIQNSIWWVETLKMGGIRQDTYGYSDKDFLRRWSCRIMEEYPGFNIVGEEWSLNPLIVGYWQRGKKNSDGYVSCLPTVMDFPLQNTLVHALKEEEDRWGTKGLIKLYEALANDFHYADPSRLMVFADNHDMDRIFTQMGRDAALTRMALTYLLTTRGIPQIYYGTEVLMDNTGFPGNHGVIRSDFPGGWKGDLADAVTGRGLTEDQINMQQYLKKLLNWRKRNKVIWEGKLMHFAPSGGVYVYFRYDRSDTVMVVMNKNREPVSLDMQRFSEMTRGMTRAEEVLTGQSVDLSTFRAPPRATTIYRCTR
jgi:neopullulanase